MTDVTPEATSDTPAEAIDSTSAAPEAPANASQFAALGLNEALTQAVERAGYTVPTPIQAQTIPPLLTGRDVLGQAQTGTGKTAAFALPMLQRIDLFKKQPQVLVLAPTRELAIQVSESFEKYSKDMKGLRVVPIYGGQPYDTQLRQLNRGVHIVVGTPGRVMDHMRRGSLKLDEMQCLVLDEADEMLKMGFADDVEWVLTQAPAGRQMALFSATMPRQIRQIAQRHLKDPAEITIAQKTATADTVNQRYIVGAPHQKQAVLARILEAEETDGVLIFCKMRSTTEPVAEYLAQAGLKTAALNGDIAQKQRERIVDQLRKGKIDIIVATDVAARGLDVERISHVINYDLPFDSEAYVHRIGRTGRAGRSGEAILFVHPRERHLLKRLENATRQPIEPMELPSNRDINKRRVAQFHERITVASKHSDLETFEAIIDHYQRENPEVPASTIAASLAVLANEGTPLLVKGEFKLAQFSGNSRGDSKDYRSGSSNRNNQRDRKGGLRRSEAGMDTYRVEVGRTHKVQPGNIVGAIANEAGIDSAVIGRINIFDSFSTVDLPQDISRETVSKLEGVYVSGRKLRISKMDDSRPHPAKKYDGKPRYNKSKSKYRKKSSSGR